MHRKCTFSALIMRGDTKINAFPNESALIFVNKDFKVIKGLKVLKNDLYKVFYASKVGTFGTRVRALTDTLCETLRWFLKGTRTPRSSHRLSFGALFTLHPPRQLGRRRGGR